MAGRYTPVDLEDHDPHPESHCSDDLSSATALDDKEWVQAPGRHGRKPIATRIVDMIKAWRWLIDTALLLVVLCLLLENRASRLHREGREREPQITSDPTGFAPRTSQHIKKFTPDMDFVPEKSWEFFSNKTQQKWLDLVPKGLGFVKIPSPEQYDGLPTPLKGFPDSTVYTTSVTHQLHCLYAIVAAFHSMRVKSDQPPPEAWHVGHCFEYLRQNILCCGDTTLEGQATTFPEGVDGSDGWDAQHVCKDYGQIYEFLEENRATDEKWI